MVWGTFNRHSRKPGSDNKLVEVEKLCSGISEEEQLGKVSVWLPKPGSERGLENGMLSWGHRGQGVPEQASHHQGDIRRWEEV